MTVTGASLLAGVSGFIAGGVVAFILGRGLHRVWLFLAGLLGTLFGAFTFWSFLLVDSLILVFGDPPSPSHALVFTLLVEAAAILTALLSTWVPQSLRMPESVDALLDSHPAGGPAQVWLIGVVLAFVVTYFGFDCALSGRAEIGTTMFHREVEGLPAVSYGVGWMSVGLFMHVHYFWTSHSGLRAYSRTAKLLMLVAASVSLTIAFYAAMPTA